MSRRKIHNYAARAARREARMLKEGRLVKRRVLDSERITIRGKRAEPEEKKEEEKP